jgi:D-inositol-3-phosphate glycosyltransferase
MSPATIAPHRRDLRPRRVAMISMHTSPLDQPGTGDAGGMNVYIVELARRLADAGTEVEVFTRSTSSQLPPVVEMVPGVLVRHVDAGPYEGLSKDELPAQMCEFSRGVLRAEAAANPGWYDLVHSHYWLSGQVGALAAERWGVPLVHSMHTMAKVKNANLARGDTPEPRTRVLGEQQVVHASNRLVANTDDEARQLRELYQAGEDDVSVIHPGVDLELFSPGEQGAARHALGLPQDSVVLLFAGRIQPLKSPDLLLRAAAALLRRRPELRDTLVVAVVGGPSGSGLEHPEALAELATDLGIADVVRFAPPATQSELADWYRAATAVCVPSRNESFGLVAVEAQACGTPVLAAGVGGLRTAVADGASGRLVSSYDPQLWATELDELITSPAELDRLSRGAALHARRFGWDATASATLDCYADARAAAQAQAHSLLTIAQ